MLISVDIYSVGIKAGIAQLVNLVQGNSSFTPQHEGFSNLTWSVVSKADGSILMTISVSHLMEPNHNFIVPLENTQQEATVNLDPETAALAGFYERPFNTAANGWAIAPMGGAITPERPIKLRIRKIMATPLKLVGVIHGWSAPLRKVPGKLEDRMLQGVKLTSSFKL